VVSPPASVASVEVGDILVTYGMDRTIERRASSRLTGRGLQRYGVLNRLSNSLDGEIPAAQLNKE
jgi:hypothetical protein